MKECREVRRLAVYFLEESYVLGIQARPGLLVLEVDLPITWVTADAAYGQE